MELARAYALLSSCRAIGMGIGPIPVTAIWQWEDRNGIDEPTLRRFVEDVITAVDASTIRRAHKPDQPPQQASDNRPSAKSKRR